MIKLENNSEYYPREVKLLMKVLKRHGGRISEKTFDRIFSQRKRVMRPDGIWQESYRFQSDYFCHIWSKHQPIVQAIGWGLHAKDEIQQGFLWLTHTLVNEGVLKGDTINDVVYYEIA
jgi:hypothetical protein